MISVRHWDDTAKVCRTTGTAHLPAAAADV
jgi:hypothetical protein